MNGARLGPAIAVATFGRIGYDGEQESVMAESATQTTKHATEDQDGPAAIAARDERYEAAQARRARQMALIDGIVRGYEPVLRELGQR